jgi:hypothetical protein
MKKTLLIITSDPRQSPRPAEALRVAAGLGAWGRLTVSILLVGEARRCRMENAITWPDGRLIEEYRKDLFFLPDHETLSAEERRGFQRTFDHVLNF